MTRLTLRLPDSLHRRLLALSAEAGTSLNQLIVGALSEAATRPRPQPGQEDSLRERVQRLRAALGDMVVEIDPADFPAWVEFRDKLPSHEELARMLPRLDPPLSQTIIEEREEARY